MRDALALASALTLLLGVFLGGIGFFKGAEYLLLLFALILIGAWVFFRKTYYLFALLSMFFLACGILRTQFVDYGLRDGLETVLDQRVTFDATVVALPDERENSTRLTVYVPEYDTRVLIVVPRYPAYGYGNELSVTGKLEHPKPFSTDGGRVFAYDKFLEKDGVGYLINNAQVEKTGEGKGFILKGLFAIRGWFQTGLEAALLEPAASLASGILIGGKQGLGKTLLDAFTVTGLLPIVVLSGYNIMIIVAAVLALLPRTRPRTTLSIAAIVVTLFVVATGMGTSAVRALLMGLLALFARAIGREYDALRILIAVLVVMVLWNPLTLLYDPGFQFSFAATLGLIVLASPLTERLSWITNPVLREIVATTIAAQLFVLPLLLYQTGNLSIVSIVANVLVLPAIPPAMLLSFIAGLVGGILPALSVYVGLPAWALLSYVLTVAEQLARLPYAHVIVPAFPAWFLVPAYAGVAWLTVKLRRSDLLPQTS